MIISGMSGNEIFCLSLKGFAPGEIAVGNSVRSLGIAGSFGRSFQTMAGGEIQNVTQMISEGRHAAIQRMEEEAKRLGAIGVTGVSTELKTLAGYTEFLAQGTGVFAQQPRPPFSTAASGVEMYCHLDSGYQPMKFVMGNVAYALGIGGGLMGGLRAMAQGEVTEYSQMYNGIRHLALRRLQEEAASIGANAVVDIKTEMLPFGPGTVELLMTGTASHHPMLAQGRLAPEQVVTSALSGPELWNLAKLGLVPQRLVMAVSVYSLGFAGGIGAMFKGMSRGELPEVTQLVYRARENCLELIRREAQQAGAERVIGSNLMIRELSPGLVEVVALGTAVRTAPNMAPESPQLIPQAVITDSSSLDMQVGLPGMPNMALGGAGMGAGAMRGRQQAMGCAVAMMVIAMSVIGAIASFAAQHH